MSEVKLYVSKNEEQLGPWTLDEIIERVARTEITLTDFVYDDQREDWVTLLEYTPLKERMYRGKPKARPKGRQREAHQALIDEMTRETVESSGPSSRPRMESESMEKALEDGQAEVHEMAARPEGEMLSKAFSKPPGPIAGGESEWFVQKGGNRFGPFTYTGLIRALQEKSVYEFDYVWKHGMERWVRIAEHDDFQGDKIRDLKARSQTESGVFFRRQFPRVKLDCEVMVHDNSTVWMGRAFEASQGGSGILVENPGLIPGQVILLHFTASQGMPAFNALCEIVSKKFSKVIRDENSPVGYGVRFIKIDQTLEPQVVEYFKTKASTEASHAAA